MAGSQSWISLRNWPWKDQLANALTKKNVNDLHVELGHPSKVIQVQYLCCDNMGENVDAILIAINIITVSFNVYIRYKYVNENLEDGEVKITFIKSTDDCSNIITKNLSVELHEKHLKKIVGEKLKDITSFKNIWS